MNDIKSFQNDDVQPLSLRERKKQLAQTTIEEAALRLFENKGYEQTSIQDIAEAVMMSSRTFFRYFASKEEVLLGPMHTIQSDSLRFVQGLASTESPQAALSATLEYLAGQYQEQRGSFLSRYRVVMQTPSIAPIYLYALMKTEPVLCEALCSHLQAATNRQEIRFLVALYMTALRVALEEWLEQQGRGGDLVSLLGEYVQRFSSLSQPG